jgi:LAO/AO transport system kinase
VDAPGLVEQARAGNPRAVARLISLVEDASPALREVMALLAPHAGNARVIGLTGSPGVGKSTSTSAMVAAYRRRGMRVGVLAVDPSSPFSGGALLGDRVRMQEHATDDGVFIRSMASRGHLGGLSWATPQALRVLSAAGCDVVLVETVGVGRPRSRSPRWPTPRWCCSPRAWGTASRPPRPASSRSPTSSS